MKAGELLAPNFFSEMLRKHKCKDTSYEQLKHRIKEFMATIRDDSDKERYVCDICARHIMLLNL